MLFDEEEEEIIKTIETKDELEALIHSGDVIFISFTTEDCRPCTAISPAYEKLANDYTQEGIVFCSLDLGAFRDIAASFNLTVVPTFHAFKNGENLGTLTHADESQLTEFVKDVIRQTRPD